MHVLRCRSSTGNDAAEMPTVPAPGYWPVPRGARRAAGACRGTTAAARSAARDRVAPFRAASTTGSSAATTPDSGTVAAARGRDSNHVRRGSPDPAVRFAANATRKSPGHPAFRADFRSERGIAHLAKLSARGQETVAAAGRSRADTAKCDSRTASSATNAAARIEATGNARDNAFLIQTTCAGGSPVAAIKARSPQRPSHRNQNARSPQRPSHRNQNVPWSFRHPPPSPDCVRRLSVRRSSSGRSRRSRPTRTRPCRCGMRLPSMPWDGSFWQRRDGCPRLWKKRGKRKSFGIT